jgi:hypothetical protein
LGVIVLELMVEEVLETGEQERPEPAEVLASFPDEVLLEQVAEEALGQVLRLYAVVSTIAAMEASAFPSRRLLTIEKGS